MGSATPVNRLAPRVLLADQSPLYRQGMKLALIRTGAACIEVDHFDAIMPQLAQAGPVDLLVLDSGLPGLDSLLRLKQLLQGFEIPVLLTTDKMRDQGFDDVYSVGVRGTVSKTAAMPQLSDALSALLSGHCWFQGPRFRVAPEPDFSLASVLGSLSAKEREVLCLLKDGLKNRQIATQLNVCESTIKSHVSKIYLKTAVKNRARLALATRELPQAILQRVADLSLPLDSRINA